MLTLTCEWCGVSFKRYPSDMKKHSFCCVDCSRSWQRVNNPKGKDHPQYKREERICDECGKVFSRQPNTQRPSKVYCSLVCKTMGFKKHNPNLGKRRELKCDWCGNVLSRPPSLIAAHNFCNYDCRSLWYSKNYSGENSPQYRDGSACDRSRGKMWRTVSSRIRERDGCCVVCGKTVQLVVHHIIPVYEVTDMLDDYPEWLLITLCRKCHSDVTHNDEIFPDEPAWRAAAAYMNRLTPAEHTTQR